MAVVCKPLCFMSTLSITYKILSVCTVNPARNDLAGTIFTRARQTIFLAPKPNAKVVFCIDSMPFWYMYA